MTFLGLGGYHASKWAVKGLSDALAQDVGSFGSHGTLVEPGPCAADWSGNSADPAHALPASDGLRLAMGPQDIRPARDGDPVAPSQATITQVDAPNPPRRLFMGISPTLVVLGVYQARLTEWEYWKAVSVAATKGANHG